MFSELTYTISVFNSCVIIYLTVLVIVLSKKQMKFQNSFKPKMPEGLPVNTQFPKLALVSKSGHEFSIDYPKSNGIIIAITATGCAICNELYPVIRDFNERMNTNYKFILLNISESDTQTHTIIQRHGLDHTAVFRIDIEDKVILDSIKLTSVPFIYVLTNRGKIIAMNNVNNEEHLVQLMGKAS